MATTPDAPSLEQVAERIAYATAQLEAWKLIKDESIAILQQLHNDGIAPTKFSSHGYNFTLQAGKKTAIKDDIAKGKLALLTAELTNEGHITQSIGSPFWVLRKS